MSSLTDNGFFVELDELYVEGMVKGETVGPRFEFDPTTYRMYFAGGRVVRVGHEAASVVLTSVNLQRKQIDFEVVEFHSTEKDEREPLAPREGREAPRGKFDPADRLAKLRRERAAVVAGWWAREVRARRAPGPGVQRWPGTAAPRAAAGVRAARGRRGHSPERGLGGDGVQPSRADRPALAAEGRPGRGEERARQPVRRHARGGRDERGGSAPAVADASAAATSAVGLVAREPVAAGSSAAATIAAASRAARGRAADASVLPVRDRAAVAPSAAAKFGGRDNRGGVARGEGEGRRRRCSSADGPRGRARVGRR